MVLILYLTGISGEYACSEIFLSFSFIVTVTFFNRYVVSFSQKQQHFQWFTFWHKKHSVPYAGHFLDILCTRLQQRHRLLFQRCLFVVANCSCDTWLESITCPWCLAKFNNVLHLSTMVMLVYFFQTPCHMYRFSQI